MIRLGLRQFRTQAIVAAVGLAVVGVVLIVTGLHLHHFHAATVRNCRTYGDCSTETTEFLSHYHFLQNALGPVVIIVPALLGLFWGAPLVARELESGTFRLAWTQSTSRARWLAIKLAIGLTASMVTAGLLTLAITWWFSPLDAVNANQYSNFGERDIVPVAYAAFAFAFGATAGAVIRRTLPAIALTLVGFTAARVAVTQWIRPHLFSPDHFNQALTAPNTGFGITIVRNGLAAVAGGRIPNTWTYSVQVVDAAGRAPTNSFLQTACAQALPGPSGPVSGGSRQVDRAPRNFQDCIAAVATKYHAAVTYQPASRYWPFQWYETAIYAAAAAALLAICFWWVLRRLT